MVIAVLATLYIGIPIDLVSLALTIFSINIAIKGDATMVNFKDKVGSGAHGAAKSILWKP